MFLVYLATACSAISFMSGLLAVDSGKHFQFKKRHILQGRRDAILYVWVICSTMFALAHCTALIDYGISQHWGYRAGDTGRWMLIHSGVGLLLTTAHVFIRNDLRGGSPDHLYLWGARSRVK